MIESLKKVALLLALLFICAPLAAHAEYAGGVVGGGSGAIATDQEQSVTVSGSTNAALSPAWVTFETFTFAATATVTLPVASFPGQTLNGVVCQNGTGGFTPTFSAATGLTITGTWPTFTTTASKCGDFSLHYTTTTQAYLVGYEAGPL